MQTYSRASFAISDLAVSPYFGLYEFKKGFLPLTQRSSSLLRKKSVSHTFEGLIVFEFHQVKIASAVLQTHTHTHTYDLVHALKVRSEVAGGPFEDYQW